MAINRTKAKCGSFFISKTTCWLFCLIFAESLFFPALATAADPIDSATSKSRVSRNTQSSVVSAPVSAKPKVMTSSTNKSTNAYVNSLMDEAEDLKVDDRGSITEKESRTTNERTDATWNYDEQSLGTCVPGLSHVEFEKNLKRNYFGTYALYQKLDPVAKSMVFKSYQEDPNIEHITKVISELVKGTHRR